MSLVTDSPVHSSSSDDFAAFLDAELDSNSLVSSPDEEAEDEESNDEEDAEDDKDLESNRYFIFLFGYDGLNFVKHYEFSEVTCFII